MWSLKLFSTVSNFSKPVLCEKHDLVPLKEYDVKERNSSVTRQSPVKKISSPRKTMSEQNEDSAKPCKETVLMTLEIQEKVEHFKNLLKEGSAAVSDGCGLSAVRNFYDALSEFKSNSSIYKLEDYEIVCLKYACGSSCCKSGTFEDLNKAINIFNEILSEHQNVRFPVAYYGLGLAHFKLNRFKEALTYFETLQSILDKGIQCTVYSWPGTVNAIEETKIEKLKVLLSDLVGKCQSPPTPAAICRHETCMYRPEIYYSDPDFKGFSTIQCQDRCVLQYHPPCWKALKDALDRTDKDFLGQQCLTPDCEFVVIFVQCIGKDGTSEKHFEIEDNEKLKKQKKSRLEKRLVMKEQKKRRRLESQNALVSETVEACDNDEDELISDCLPNVIEPSVVKETVNNEAARKTESNLSADAKPFYVRKDEEMVPENANGIYMWKKDTEPVLENEKVSKSKERKKGKKPVALSLDEFRQKIQDFSYYSEYKMRLHHLQQNINSVEDRKIQWSTICESEKIPNLDPNRPFYIPEHLRDDPHALETVLQSYSTNENSSNSETMREKIYMHLEEILGWYGPMRADDPTLLEEIAKLPASYQQLVTCAGGLKDFLLASMRFAFVGDHICVISDVLKAYSIRSEPYHGEGYSNGCDQEYEELPNGIAEEDDFGCASKFHSVLNPHATEYSPVSSVLSTNSVASENCSSEGHQSDLNEMKEELIELESSLKELMKPFVCNGQSATDLMENNDGTSIAIRGGTSNRKSETPASSTCFSVFNKLFDCLADEMRKLPDDEKFDVILKMLKYVLNDEYYGKNIPLFNQHLKPFTFSLIPKRQNKCLQVGTPVVNMHSKGVMKDDEYVKALVENFHDLEHYRNNMNEEKKIVEGRLEYSLDTIAQLQNALVVAEMSKEKEMEEIQVLLEDERKEAKKKEKNWEKEQKRLELNQAKINEQLKSCREEIKNLKDQLAKKDACLKEIEDLKKTTEIDLKNISKAKSEVEASLHATLQYQEIEVAAFTKKLQDAQLEILTMKKSNVIEKILAATKNAELRLKEIQDGLPVVNHPLFLEQLKSLQSQIKEHIVKLGKIHSDFLKTADDQINELQKGKDLSDLPPLLEPTLSECPVLKAPLKSASPSLSPNSVNLASGNSSQVHPNITDWNSFGLMLQTPNSGSVQFTGTAYNPLLKTFAQNQKLAAPQGTGFQGTPIFGNFPGLSAPNNSYPMQNLNMLSSSSLFDPAMYPSTTSSYLPKMAGFQPNLPRAPLPPGLNVPIRPSSQSLPNSLPQTSSVFQLPQTPQQSACADQPVLQTPFSFGLPQLHNKGAVTQLNTSDKTEILGRSASEIAFLNVLKKTEAKAEEKKSPLESETQSEKSVLKENTTESNSTAANAAPLDLVSHQKRNGSPVDSTSSSPVPFKNSNQSGSSHSISVPASKPHPVSKQAPTSDDLVATGVKLKQPIGNAKQKKTGKSSCSGGSSVVSDYDTFNLDFSAPEGSALELDYTMKEAEAPTKAKCVQPSASVGGVDKATTGPPKSVPATNSYEKLIVKLMLAYPQCLRDELMECVSVFRRNHNNKLSHLKFSSIITGIGEILERRKNHLTHAPQKKKPQLQVVSLTKKAAPPPPPAAPEKSGICPWAKTTEPPNTSAPWHGDNADTSCSICLEEMTVRRSVQRLECGHRFHLPCLKEWLHKNSNCPICRVHVLLPEDYPSLT